MEAGRKGVLMGLQIEQGEEAGYRASAHFKTRPLALLGPLTVLGLGPLVMCGLVLGIL